MRVYPGGEILFHFIQQDPPQHINIFLFCLLLPFPNIKMKDIFSKLFYRFNTLFRISKQKNWKEKKLRDPSKLSQKMWSSLSQHKQNLPLLLPHTNVHTVPETLHKFILLSRAEIIFIVVVIFNNCSIVPALLPVSLFGLTLSSRMESSGIWEKL